MARHSDKLSGNSADPVLPAPDAVAKVASIEGVSASDIAALEAQIADLRKQLEVSEDARSDSEKHALELAKNQASSIMQSVIQEVPTGKTVKVSRCKSYEVVSYKDDGRAIHKPIMHEVDMPTYFYRIDLPPIGGEGLKINQIELRHGLTVELDQDTLRTVKDMVYRVWAHEKNVHGENENAYRTMNNRSSNTGRQVNI